MSTRKFRTLITDAGLAKLAATTAPGGQPVRLTHMAVGDGNGELRQPQGSQTRLYREVWRHAVNRTFTDPQNPNHIIAELVIPPETGGFWVREIGVFDDAGTLIAVGNTAESYKPTAEEGSGRAQTFRAVLTVSAEAVVELVVDSTTVVITAAYVDEKIAEHERSRRHPDATLTAKGFTQLSSATDSDDETRAATPKAVKTAYDLAKGKAPATHNHPWSQITGVPAATTSRTGIVQLSSATDSDDETRAATPKAVKDALRLASQSAGPEIQDATTTRKGIVQLSSATSSTSESLAATPKAVKAVRDEILRTVVKDIRTGAARTVTVNTGETGAGLGGPSLLSRMVARNTASDLIIPGGGGRPGDPSGGGTATPSSGGVQFELTCHSVQKLINNQWLNVE